MIMTEGRARVVLLSGCRRIEDTDSARKQLAGQCGLAPAGPPSLTEPTAITIIQLDGEAAHFPGCSQGRDSSETG